MHTLKAVPAIIFALCMSTATPMPAQQPLVGSLCTLMHFGERSEPMFEALRALPKMDDLLEMRLAFRSTSRTDDYDRYVGRHGMSRGSKWALTAQDGVTNFRILAQGIKPPTVADIQTALNSAGVQSPISALRDFLKMHPGHLDARVQLLSHLRSIAEEHTRLALQVGAKTSGGKPDDLFMVSLDDDGMNFIDPNPSEADTPDDKKLAPEQDAKIWGPYANELQAIFSNGDWRLVSLPRPPDAAASLDGHSPMMAQIYRAHLPKLESFLEEYPSNYSLWQTYAWMAPIANRGATMALLGRLVPTPQVADRRMVWPGEMALNLMVAEEGAKNNWSRLADALMNYWPSMRLYLLSNRQSFAEWLSEEEIAARTKRFSEEDLQKHIMPMLEPLIKANRVGDAETIIIDIARTPRYRDIQRMGADLAKDLGRQDLHARWLKLQIPEKKDLDMDDLYAELVFKQSTSQLILINAEEHDNKKIDEMLGQGRINDWHVSRSDIGPNRSEFLQKREGWPADKTYWALINDNKMFASGDGLPTEDALTKEFELARIQTPANILRRFVLDNPAQYEAKERLLKELKRIAEQKTKEKLGKGTGSDASLMLSNDDDYAIWGEYASLYRRLLPYILEQGRLPGIGVFTSGPNSPTDSAFFMHSQTMKNLANLMLPLVEARLLRQPTNDFLWSAWSALSDLHGHRNFREIKDGLVLSPLTPPQTMLSQTALKLIMERYAANTNWQGMIDIQEWCIEIWASQKLTETIWFEVLWQDCFQYLIEAYLRMNKDSEANELVRHWSQYPGWQQIKQHKVDLAKKCGKDNLAEQWAKL